MEVTQKNAALPREDAYLTADVPLLGRGLKRAAEILAMGKGAELLSYADITVSPKEFIEAVEAAKKNFGRSAVTRNKILPINVADFDGTLIKDATGPFMFEMIVKHRFLKPAVFPRLDEMRKLLRLDRHPGWEREDDLGMHQDLIRIKEGFQAFLRREDFEYDELNQVTKAFYAMCSQLYAGHTVTEVKRLAARAMEETPLGTNFFEGAREVIESLRGLGITTMVASATFEPIVKTVAAKLGIDPSYIRGTRLRVNREGVITDELEALLFREGKIEAVRDLMQRYYNADAGWDSSPERVGERERPAFAMGDSPSKSDEHLLTFARAAIVVEPQTKADLKVALEWANAGKPVMILDYERSIGGEAADRYSLSRHGAFVREGDYV